MLLSESSRHPIRKRNSARSLTLVAQPLCTAKSPAPHPSVSPNPRCPSAIRTREKKARAWICAWLRRRRPVAGGLRATIYGPADQPFPAIHCGDQIRALVAMHLPERYLDPGVWDATAWLRQQGIGVVGSLKVSVMTLTSTRARRRLSCWLHSVQQAGSQRLIDFAGSSASSRLPPWLRLSYPDAGMLSAMILGDRTYLDHQARVGFERTGSFHLLVVSGMHLAIFAACIFGLADGCGFPHLVYHRDHYLFVRYALLAGFGEPVQRSFWMVTLYLLARLLFRKRNSLNAIGFAALCLLALDPRSLREQASR